MNWLDIAGGVGQGVSEGTKDIRDFESQRLQQQLAKQQIGLNKTKLSEAQDTEAARQQIKGLKKPGTVYDGPDTGEPGVPPTQKTYSESQHAKESAGIYRQYGLMKPANEESDRAQQQAVQEYQNKVMALARKAPYMPLDAFANEAANLKTDDDTHVNAAVYKDPQTGQLMGAVYHGNQPGAVNVPITSHQQVIDMMMKASTPENYFNTRKLEQGDRMAGAAETTAGAHALSSKTGWEKYLEEKGAGLFTAQASHLQAQAQQARAEAGLAPAKAEELKARAGYEQKHGDLAEAQGKRFAAQASTFEDKLPEGQKMLLQHYKSMTEKAMAAAASDPTNKALQLNLRNVEYETFKMYQRLGMDVDPYALSGREKPDTAAKAISKLEPKKQEIALAGAEKAYGRDYAEELRAALQASQPAPGKQNVNGITVPSAPVPVENRPNNSGQKFFGKYAPIEEQ